MYLPNRYGWTAQVFSSIDWLTHQREFTKVQKLQQVTLTKFVHGWLATSRRRYRNGGVERSCCPLCTVEETRQHMFRCSNPQFVQLRNQRWAQFQKELRADTDIGFQAVFLAGLETVLGGEFPKEPTRTEWPQELREAFDSQTDIGWDQIIYGRLGTNWEPVAQYRDWGQTGNGTTKWTGSAIRAG